MDATRDGYEDCIKDPDGAAEILLKAAPGLSEASPSQKYLADQYQAAASVGPDGPAGWDDFFSWSLTRVCARNRAGRWHDYGLYQRLASIAARPR